MSKEKTTQPILFVGIDWADVDHVACWIDSTDQQQAIEYFTQEPESIAKWLSSLKKKFPNHRILRVLEQSRGALIAGLANHSELELYPSIPGSLPATAMPLTKDPALIQPRSKYVQTQIQLIRELNKGIVVFNEELQKLVAKHADQELFRSLPSAGDAIVPRLIAAFDSDRNRYQSAEQIQCYSGIAPITRQSGKSRYVNKRIACPKFLRQTSRIRRSRSQMESLVESVLQDET